MLVAFLLVGAMDIAKTIADKLVGGDGDTNFQKKVAKMGLAVLTWAGIGVGKKIVGTAMKAGAAHSSKFRAMQGIYKGVRSKLQSLAGDDDEDES